MRRRALGQHYLVDPSAVSKLVSLAEIEKDERVLEIGTGEGALTRELAKVANHLEGYEVDEANLELTRAAVQGQGVRLHLGDAFEARPVFDVLVASLPYSRSSSFVEWISQIEYDRAVVVLQLDFVRKILARPGQRDYRAISVIAQASADIREEAEILRSSFSPQPKVNSVIATFKPKRKLTEREIGSVKRLFSLRKRQVGAVLAELGGAAPPGLSKKRVYTLPPDQALALASGMQR